MSSFNSWFELLHSDMPAPRTHYDEVLYPSALYQQTHPDRLATLATLFGLAPPSIDACRVLELGCGDGQNLFAMAVTLPGSTFHGIDLASVPIERGQQLIRRIGLSNVSLLQRDLLDLPDDFGTFDFIIAHGLYSWVPQPVRDKILALCSRCLDRHGVAYISYNAQPGNHLRELARGFMRYHAAHFPTPPEQIRQARAFLQFMAENISGNEACQQALRQERERVNSYPEAALFHDDLSTTNTAFYFHEFAAAAAQHGLQFLAEADITDMQTDGLAPACVRLLEELPAGDVVAREQYRDFFRTRAFRQTLLCHAGCDVMSSADALQVPRLHVACSARPLASDVDLASGEAVEFRAANNAVIATQQPLINAALLHLGEAWPQRVAFAELLELARARCGLVNENDSNSMANFLLKTWEIGFTDLHVHPGAFATKVSARPRTSSLARLQIESADTVATLRHTRMKLEGALSRELVRLLDGTRDRSGLLAALVEFAANESRARALDQKDIAQKIDGQLDAQLDHLARGALLSAS